MAITLDDARRLFERRRAAWLAEDLDAYLACWHDDLRITIPPGRVVQGAAEYRRMVATGFAWAAPVSFTVHALATDGPVVLADWTIRVRRRTDGVLLEWHGLSVCELEGGRIRWWREHHLAPPAPVTS